MTTPDPGRETRIVDVKGRNVVVRAMVDAQMVLMAREAKLLQRDDVSSDRKLSGVSRMFDILESTVVQDEDREYLENLIAAGDLDLRELLSFVTVFATEDKPKVRRGRPTARKA
jgi:hypothetical protein